MDITKEFLQAQLSEALNQSKIHFANFHRAEAVIQMIETLIKRLDTVEADAEKPETK